MNENIGKPEIIKSHYWGTYRQETGRGIKTLITDIKRTVLNIEGGQYNPIDKDIIKLAEHLKNVCIELELMMAYKFPDEIDISKEDLKKHYGISL